MTTGNQSSPRRLSKNSIFKIDDNQDVKQSKSLFYKLKESITRFFK